MGLKVSIAVGLLKMRKLLYEIIGGGNAQTTESDCYMESVVRQNLVYHFGLINRGL